MHRTRFLQIALASCLLLTACSSPIPRGADLIGALLPPPAPPEQPISPAQTPSPLQALGYTIQVGAFSQPDNAFRLQEKLQSQGIDAYHFLHESGLYKVRFGDHASYATARAEAESLRGKSLIDAFFIVAPEEHTAARIGRTGQGDLRHELVFTAHRYLGIPYRWGGTTVKEGFDCSGLTLVVYRLNGLNLPRVSRDQFSSGRPVEKSDLKKGDLVFFATNGGKRVSHVGIYIGNGNFIHAPRKGKTVRIASLSAPFFKKTYMGGRTFL